MARLRISTVVTLASFCLLGQLADAQYYPRNTALNGTTFKAKPTTTSSSSDSVTSFFSDIQGPFVQAVSSTWTQIIIPTTVGTVLVVVNEATNQTSSTTIYHTDYERNGSSTLLTRTDTDAAGTVTQIVTDEKRNQSVTIAYPTNYFVAAESLTWNAILPTIFSNNICCFETPTLSATPTHTPFVQIGPLDDGDSRGWLYSLVGVNYGEAVTVLDSTEVSSLWSGQTIKIEYDGCPYTYCSLTSASAAPASAVQVQPGAILATSTTTISILPAAPASSKVESTPTAKSATFTAVPDQESTKRPETTAPKNTQPQSSKFSEPSPAQPESTQVSGASPQTSAQQIPPSQQSSKPKPQSGTENTISAPAPSPGITPGPSPSKTGVSEPTGPSQTVDEGLVITIGSSVLSANSASQFIIASQTLGLGSLITVGSGSSTTVIALQTSGTETVLVVGGTSSTLRSVNVPALTVGGSVVTADSASNYVVAGQTLVPGGSAIVVDGTTISLASGGTQLIEGIKTIVPSTAIGGIIWSVFGGGATGTGTQPAGETGSAVPTYQQASQVGSLWPCSQLAMFLASLICLLLI